jgi:TRAP-type C4-dicarboxylate transport system substrate-binding protein
MPASEMYNALQTGLVDGILTGSSAILDFKLNEVAASYTSGASFGNVLFYAVMSEARYQGLTDAQKAAVDAAAGLALSKSGEEGWNAKGAKALETLRADSSKRVIDLTAEEAAPFNAITVGLADQVVADLDAKGLPATAARAAMLGK